MVESTNVLCPLFDEIDILIAADSPSISFPISGQNVIF